MLEYVVRDLFLRHVPDERAGTRPLENLIARLVKDGVLDLHVKAYVDHVRELGNAATHADVSKDFSEDDAFRADALMVVLDWYFKKERIGDIDELRREVDADQASLETYRSRSRQAEQGRRTAALWRQFGGAAGVCIAAVAVGLTDRWWGIGPPWPPAPRKPPCSRCWRWRSRGLQLMRRCAVTYSIEARHARRLRPREQRL